VAASKRPIIAGTRRDQRRMRTNRKLWKGGQAARPPSQAGSLISQNMSILALRARSLQAGVTGAITQPFAESDQPHVREKA